MKKVIYNGGRDSYCGCTDPSVLVKGKEYEVIAERVSGWHTEYTLRGVNGEFNSCWFTSTVSAPTFVAFASKAPKEGERYKCNKLVAENGKVKTINWETSTVLHSEIVGQSVNDTDITYKVTTRNSIYLVHVPYGII